MSAGGILLIFMDADGIGRWLRIADGAVVARGDGLEGLIPDAGTAPDSKEKIAAVLPGDEVSLHWAELPPGLSDPQAQAAGRMIAAELGAQSPDQLHVAVGPEQDGRRCIAIAANLRMARIIGQLQDQGFDPDVILSAPLLLPPPASGLVRYDGKPLPLIRGRTEAYSVEPDLIAVVTGGKAVEPIDDAAFDAGIAAALDALPVNLRQGPFAKRKRWRIDWRRVRRIAMLAAAALIVTGAIQIASIVKTSMATDRAEQEARTIAARAVPGGGPADLERRLAGLGGGNALAPLAAALFDGIRTVPNVQLSALTYDPAGLRATILADAPGSIAAVQQQMTTAGLRVEAGPMRMEGGRSTAELIVRAR